MAQLPSSARVNQYTATAGQTTFTYDFMIYNDDEIKVQQGNTTLTLTTDYTVTDAGETAGGTVVLVTGATVGDIITLTSDSMVERGTTFTQGGDFLASAVNGEFNRLDNLISELVTESSTNFKLATYSETVSPILPTPAANKCLVWNAGATALENSTYDPDAAQTASAASAAAAAASETAAGLSETAAAASELAAGTSETNAAASALEAAGYAASIAPSAFASDLIPDADGTRDLGSAAKEWAEIHCTDAYVYDDLTVTDDVTVSGKIAVTETSTFSNDIDVTGDVQCATLTVGTVPSNIQKAVQVMVVMDVKNQNTAPDAITTGAWRTLVLNTVTYDGITGASLASNQVTLPAGTYDVFGTAYYYVAATAGSMVPLLYDTTATADIIYGPNTYVSSDVGHCHIHDVFTLAVPSALEFRARVTANGYAGSVQANLTTEKYTSLVIRKLA